MREIYETLRKRYTDLAKDTDSEQRIGAMMHAVVDHCESWPPDKTGRWVGFVQCLLIEVEKVTTIDEERNFTRPLFHRMYSEQGRDIPESLKV